MGVRVCSPLAMQDDDGYRHPVAANSATGLGGLTSTRRNSATNSIAGAFFAPATSRYGGLRRSTLGCAGLLVRRSANPAQSATLLCLAAERGGSSVQGASLMNALNPSDTRAAAHRAMALAALRANSSLAVRLRRYNHHMAIVRSMESAQRA